MVRVIARGKIIPGLTLTRHSERMGDMNVYVEYLPGTEVAELLGDDGKGNVRVEFPDGTTDWVPDHMVWPIDEE
jgi:hypothetical protein